MNEYSRFKRRIQQRMEALEGAVRDLGELELVDPSQASRWRAHLDEVERSLQESLLRVAVVGSVKSGKSTLINSLMGVDLLKRGAGIVTAFITRIRSSAEAGGWVELKSWPQVIEELNAALRMLPPLDEDAQEEAVLDIRSPEDRERIAARLGAMQSEWQQARGRLDTHFMLLSAYLEGYNRLHGSVGESVTRLLFDSRTISQHQHYVGEEMQAVYLRDMELHYPAPWLGSEVEIADCQGSDSPNPIHFALLQQYVLRSHFILYVISSRTGLREADFKLLDFIKSLRMLPQTFFVLNADLDVHPHGDDLAQLTERVRSELAWIVPNPQIFTFSALYHLIGKLGEGASKREMQRLDLWRSDPQLAERTEKGFSAFRDALIQRINGQRTRVLLGTGLSRLAMVAGALKDTTEAQRKFIDASRGSIKKTTAQLKSKQKTLNATLGTLENSIAGFRGALKREVDEACRRYFDPGEGLIIQETLDMVEHYPVDPKYLGALTDPHQVLKMLHGFYLEFRHSLSRYIVERINLRIIAFAKEQEAFLEERFQYSSRAFWSLFATSLEDYRREMAKFGIELRPVGDCPQAVDSAFAKKIAPPPFDAFVGHHMLGRGVLLMKFGLGRLTRFLTDIKSRLGKRTISKGTSQSSENLQEAIHLVKSEAKAELLQAFQEYRDSFRSQYLHRLLEQGAEGLVEGFRIQAEMAQLDLANLLKQSDAEGERRRKALEVLAKVGDTADSAADELGAFLCAVNLEWLSDGGQAGPEPPERLSTAQGS